MEFDEQKKKTLNWKDQSKKGSWDVHILPLLEKINEQPNYYTTSSCAGRITLLQLSDERKKNLSEWVYVSHEFADFKRIKEALSKYEGLNQLWFKMESAIVHVCCKTLDDASLLLTKAKESGFKHSGILSIGKRIIVEIFGSEKLETIIYKDNKLLITEDYLKELVLQANKKLEITRKKIKKFKLLII